MATQTTQTIDKFEFEWEDDEDIIDTSVKKSSHTIILVGKQHASTGRLIAGHKRAMKEQNKHLNAGGSRAGDGEIMQSITAMPALRHSSFEELRLECYFQSSVAKGAPPAPVDPIMTPWAVIPPVFKPVANQQEEREWEPRDTPMLESEKGAC